MDRAKFLARCRASPSTMKQSEEMPSAHAYHAVGPHQCFRVTRRPLEMAFFRMDPLIHNLSEKLSEPPPIEHQQLLNERHILSFERLVVRDEKLPKPI